MGILVLGVHDGGPVILAMTILWSDLIIFLSNHMSPI